MITHNCNSTQVISNTRTRTRVITNKFSCTRTRVISNIRTGVITNTRTQMITHTLTHPPVNSLNYFNFFTLNLLIRVKLLE